MQVNTTQAQPYNNFRVQTLGGNIVQGQLNKIRVAEVLFPYGIPTVLDYASSGLDSSPDNARMFVVFQSATYSVGGTVLTTTGSALQISLPTGFYTGTEMAATIQAAISAKEVLLGIPAGTFTVAYSTSSGTISWLNNSVFATTDASQNWFLEITQATGASAPNFSNPNLLWTVGLRDVIGRFPPVGPTIPNRLPSSNGGITLVPFGYPNAPGASTPPLPVYPAGYAVNGINGSTYTGLYTQYIDICSPTLCQAQYVRDGNTNQKVIRRDLICRLYIANEVSMFQTDPTGTRPFVIHRQFKNAKVMKWTADRSIDSIDIQLYDQFGNPLPVLPGYIDGVTNVNGVLGSEVAQGAPADFALTFLVDEPGAEQQGENVGYRV